MRNKFIKSLKFISNDKVLYVATGTGDIAFSIRKKYKSKVIGLDLSAKMLEVAKENSKKYNIAYHSACSMQHGQKVHKQPVDLLKKTGNKILDIPDGHICCGSAGTYNILHVDIAKKFILN